LSDSMDFVHDYGLCGLQKTSATLGCEQDVKRFRSGNQNVGRGAQHRLPFARWRITRSYRHPNFRNKHTFRPRELTNLGERLLKVFGNIVAESFERRNIDDTCGVV